MGNENEINYVQSEDRVRTQRLFHYTKRYDYLMGIISNGLRCSLVCEKIPKPGQKRKKLAYTISCVCLCDTPLSRIKKHMKTYGQYAIGFSKTKINDITAVPVIYSNEDICDLKNRDERKEFYEKYKILTRRIKMVRGRMASKEEEKTHMVHFIEENEWRFFNSNKCFSIIEYDTDKDLVNKFENKKNEMKNNNAEYIKFDLAKDVEYIILPSKDDYRQFVEDIREKYSDQFEEILPKVLLYNRLKNDL